MEFKINEEFAKHYNDYRQKEEMQKLKSRYGDVKLKKKLAEDGDAENNSGNSSSSSSSSSSESDSEWDEVEHEDFLRLYDALCRDDPALNDEEKVWFREKPEDGEKMVKEKGRPVLLKDHTRDLLLAGEQEDVGAETSTPADSNQDAKDQKEAFLAEAEKLFDNEEGDLLSKKTPKSKSEKRQKPPIDTSHFTFPVSHEDEEFLRDYLVNRRWKAAEQKPSVAHQKTSSVKSDADGMVDEILAARKKSPSKDIEVEPLLTAPEELEEDDDFLVKARRFEDAWNNDEEEELAKQYPTTVATRYRFEEEDKEFIKTYPRKIEDSLRQPSAKGMTRAQKRKARAERKAAEKAAKMADIERLKRLKMAEFAEKLERIRRSCGDGVAMEAKISTSVGDLPPLNEVTEEMIDCLDNDWDPEAHDRLVSKLFGDDYYGASTTDDALDEAPKGESDEEEDFFMQNLDTGDYDDYLPRQHGYSDRDGTEGSPPKMDRKKSGVEGQQDGETSALVRAAKEIYSTLMPRKRGKRAHGRSLLRSALDRKKPTYDPRQHPDFEKYFNEFYQLDCEDIINGNGPEDDVHCRFKYRSVKPNDFGLSLEEILKADEKELNRWVSVKTMSAYRTEEEEERDIRKYHSSKMLRKKTDLIPSLLRNEEDEEGKSKEEDKVEPAEGKEKRMSKKALKRLRKKQRKAELFSALVAAETEVKQNRTTPEGNEASKCQSKVESEVSETAKGMKEPHQAKKRKLEASDEKPMVEEVKLGQKKNIHHHHHKNLSKKPKLTDERLRAAGIDPKQFKFMKSNFKK